MPEFVSTHFVHIFSHAHDFRYAAITEWGETGITATVSDPPPRLGFRDEIDRQGSMYEVFIPHSQVTLIVQSEDAL